jgi:hypothetical protein
MEQINCTNLLGRHVSVYESIADVSHKVDGYAGSHEVVAVWMGNHGPQLMVINDGELKSYGMNRVRVLPPDFTEVDF